MSDFDEISKNKFARVLASSLRVYLMDKNPEKTSQVIRSLSARGGLRSAMEGLNDKNIGTILKYFIRYMGKSSLAKPTLEAVQIFVDVYASRVDKFGERNLCLYLDLIDRLIDELDFCKRFCELQYFKKCMKNESVVENDTEMKDAVVPVAAKTENEAAD